MKIIAYYDQSKHSSYDHSQLLGQMVNMSMASCQGPRNRRMRYGVCPQEVHKLVG